MTARNERPSSGWWLIDELALSTSCPAWCAKHTSGASDPSEDGTGGTGTQALCLFHAAQAVEDDDLAPADLTVAPVPGWYENSMRAR